MVPARMPPSTLWLEDSKGCLRRVRTQRRASSLQREQSKRTLNPPTARSCATMPNSVIFAASPRPLDFWFQATGLSWQEFQGGSLASGTNWAAWRQADRTSCLTRENAGTGGDHRHLKGKRQSARGARKDFLESGHGFVRLEFHAHRDETALPSSNLRSGVRRLLVGVCAFRKPCSPLFPAPPCSA